MARKKNNRPFKPEHKHEEISYRRHTCGDFLWWVNGYMLYCPKCDCYVI